MAHRPTRMRASACLILVATSNAIPFNRAEEPSELVATRTVLTQRPMVSVALDATTAVTERAREQTRGDEDVTARRQAVVKYPHSPAELTRVRSVDELPQRAALRNVPQSSATQSVASPAAALLRLPASRDEDEADATRRARRRQHTSERASGATLLTADAPFRPGELASRQPPLVSESDSHAPPPPSQLDWDHTDWVMTILLLSLSGAAALTGLVVCACRKRQASADAADVRDSSECEDVSSHDPKHQNEFTVTDRSGLCPLPCFPLGDLSNTDEIPEPVPVKVVLSHIVVEVNDRKLLDDVSASYGPNELAAIMGPSGAGKTRLISSILGLQATSSGYISVNGQPYDAESASDFTAYVPQDDMLFKTLTPREVLTDQTIFKTNLAPRAAKKRVDHVLRMLMLEESADVRVGDSTMGQQGLSGGQKKRLSVALELVNNPSLLILDEPTSGLDSISALTLVKLLKTLAEQGATVISTIHQPSSTLFDTCDSLTLLCKGQLCAHLPISESEPLSFFRSAGFECPPRYNPADFVMEVVMQSYDHVTKLRDATEKKKAGEATADEKKAVEMFRLKRHPVSTVYWKLLVRSAKNVARDPVFVRVRVGTTIGSGTILGCLFFDTGTDSLGLEHTLMCGLSACIIQAIVAVLPPVILMLPEFSTVVKEHRNGYYPLAAYYLAKLVVDIPFCLILPLIYVSIFSSLSGLVKNSDGNFDGEAFFIMYLAIVLINLIGNAWACFIVSVAPNESTAIFMVPATTVPLILMSGMFISVHLIPWPFRLISYVGYLSYVWELMMWGVLDNKKFTLEDGREVGPEYTLHERLEFDGLFSPKAPNVFLCLLMALIILTVYHSLAYLMLRRKVLALSRGV